MSLSGAVDEAAAARAERRSPSGHGRPHVDTSTGMRQYGLGAQILRAMGLGRIRLLSNSKIKLAAVEGFGLSIAEVIPLDEARRN